MRSWMFCRFMSYAYLSLLNGLHSEPIASSNGWIQQGVNPMQERNGRQGLIVIR